MSELGELSQLQPDKSYVVVVLCGEKECKAEIDTSKPMTGKAIRDKWALLVMSAPLQNFKCPKGCRRSFSDCNANIDFTFRETTDDLSDEAHSQ